MRRVSGQVPPRTQLVSYIDRKSTLTSARADFLYLLMPIGHRVDVLILPYGHYARRWAAAAIYTWQHSWSAYTSIGVWFSGFSAANSLICRRTDTGCRSIAARPSSSTLMSASAFSSHGLSTLHLISSTCGM